MARRLGVKVASLVRDLQERYNAAVVFYETGKLAIATEKWWKQYDRKYQIQERADMMKQMALKRAAEFKQIGGKLEADKYMNQLQDVWKVVTTVPNRAQRLNRCVAHVPCLAPESMQKVEYSIRLCLLL